MASKIQCVDVLKGNPWWQGEQMLMSVCHRFLTLLMSTPNWVLQTPTCGQHCKCLGRDSKDWWEVLPWAESRGCSFTSYLHKVQMTSTTRWWWQPAGSSGTAKRRTFRSCPSCSPSADRRSETRAPPSRERPVGGQAAGDAGLRCGAGGDGAAQDRPPSHVQHPRGHELRAQ